MTAVRSRTSAAARLRRPRLVALLGALVLALSLAGTASAREVASGGGGGGGGTTACNPVSSLTAKGDPRVGETGLASIDVTYSVKPCDATPVTVTTRVAEWFDPTAIAWDDAAAPLSGKFTVFGIRLRTTYRVAVEVRSAVDGSLLGSQQVGVAAVPKGV